MGQCIRESQFDASIHTVLSGPYDTEGECVGGCGSSSSSSSSLTSSSSSSSLQCSNPVKTVSVDSTISYGPNSPKYVNTGVWFDAGRPLSLFVSGSVQWNGPGSDSTILNSPLAGLPVLGLFDASADQYMGGSASFTISGTDTYAGVAPSSGYLFLAVEDSLYSDNAGSYSVLVCSEGSSSSSSSSSTVCYMTPTACSTNEFTIESTQSVFTGTGIYLSAGESYSIVARGCASCSASIPGNCDAGPDGSSHPQKFLQLIAAINPSQSATLTTGNPYFAVGSSFQGTAASSGYLYLGVYDWVYSDNQGNFCVQVTKN